MQSEDQKNLVLATLEDIKAKDIIALEVKTLTNITDYMVICSGTSSRHIKSMSEHIIKAAKEAKLHIIGIEGTELSEWILVDLGDVVVHIMLPEVRDFYQLEKLWGFDPLKSNEN